MQNQGHLDEIQTCQTEIDRSQHFENSEPIISCKFDSAEHQFAIEIMCKIMRRNYSRYFIKGLTFAYIQALRNQQRKLIETNKIENNINWPFRSLVMKKNRNQDQQEMYQFLNLCAQLIQSRFKGYITRKRHQIAINRAKRAKDLLSSFISRWKVYRVFNCEKIVSIRTKISQIQKQINEQQQNFTNRDAKKLKALYKYLEIHNKMFKDTFEILIETGMWTLEKNMNPKIQRKYAKPQKKYIMRIQQKPIQEQHIPAQSTYQAPKRVVKKEDKKQNIDQNVQNEFMMTNTSTTYTSIDNRPIKAAGQYKFDEFQEPPTKNASPTNQQQSPSNASDKQLRNKERIRKQQELQKRKKYDPRKAVEEEKKRRKEIKQKEVSKNDTSILANPSIISENKQQKIEKQNEKQPTIQKEQTVQKQKAKKPVNIKAKKQKIEPQPKKSNQNNSRHPLIKKITSKVDCWGSKKEQEPEWVKQYKMKMMEQTKKQRESEQHEGQFQELRKSIEKSNSKYVGQTKNLKVKIEQQLRNRTMVKIETEVERIRKKSTVQAMKEKQRQIESLKQKQTEYIGKRKNSGDYIQDQARTYISKNIQKKKNIHIPIQQLEQTYNKNYLDRLQNLMPKLNLMAVTRNEQCSNLIPVIDQSGQQFNDWFEELYNSKQFWKKAGSYQKIYKTFVSS